MAVESWPAFLQAESYSGEQLRRSITDGLLSRNSSGSIGTTSGGIYPASGELAVTAPVSGLSVNVAAGVCWVPGSTSFASVPGGYYLRNTATLNVTGISANGSNPTIYAIVATIGDAAYHGTNSATIQAIAGTPSSGASLTNLTGAPSIPDASLLLAWVLVPTSATNIITADILNWSSLVKNSSVNQYPGDVPAVAHLGLPQCGPLSDSSGSNDTLKPFQHRICSSGSPTYTLPAPFPGCVVKVSNYGSGTPIVSQNVSEKIYGAGISGAGANAVYVPTGWSVTVESDGTSWYETVPVTPPGSTLGSVQYNPGSPTTYNLTGSIAAVDNANLAVSFVAPAPGAVIFTWQTFGDIASGGAAGIIEGSIWDVNAAAELSSTYRQQLLYTVASSVTMNGVCLYRAKVTGLTPGASCKWAPAALNVNNAGRLYAGAATTLFNVEVKAA